MTVFLKSFFLRQNAHSGVQSVCFYLFIYFPHFLLPVSHHHYISQYFLLRQGLAESVFMFWGVEKAEGDKEEGSREIIV